jgi:hypothetical protein
MGGRKMAVDTNLHEFAPIGLNRRERRGAGKTELQRRKSVFTGGNEGNKGNEGNRFGLVGRGVEGDILVVRKRRVILLLIGVAALASVIVVVSNFEREPAYGGKKLSEWVEKSAGWHEGAECANAIRIIGSNAVPYLVSWVGYEAPAWKRKLYTAANGTIGRLKPAWTISDRREIRAAAVPFAFRSLGPLGEKAIPELIRLMNNPTATRSAIRAVDCLAAMGGDGIPPLRAISTTNRYWLQDYVSQRLEDEHGGQPWLRFQSQ